MFPYHYGSYATRLPDNFIVCPARFHTTMVLTQLAAVPKAIRELEVSIPLWFLRNMAERKPRRTEGFRVSIPLWFLRNPKNSDPFSQSSVKFPYHYGSYATRWNLNSSVSWRSVSIPLWFLRNDLSECLLGYAGYVSIPLWFLRN